MIGLVDHFLFGAGLGLLGGGVLLLARCLVLLERIESNTRRGDNVRKGGAG